MIRDPASFRDPFGNVFRHGDRIVRLLTSEGMATLHELAGALPHLERSGLIDAQPIDPPDGFSLPSGGGLIEHPKLPFVSYPFEWSFEALKAAALHHLDLQIEALARGVSFVDASAYNVQFIGAKPIFIDYTSLRRYAPGEFWAGYQQFRETFLNPLLISALSPLPFNGIYRGYPRGIPAPVAMALVPKRRWLRRAMLLHVLLPQACAGVGERGQKAGKQALATSAYGEILAQLRRYIARLHPHRARRSGWAGYAEVMPYSGEERAMKRAVVERHVARWQPRQLFDAGCNTGEMALAALEAGARYVVGCDKDEACVDAAFAAARAKDAAFTPIVADLCVLSSGSGWRGQEFRPLVERIEADAILALALVHHLAAAAIPLEQSIAWIVESAPRGIIEFVPPSDPVFTRLTASLTRLPDDYRLEAFDGLLARAAHIVERTRITASGRIMAVFERRANA